MFTAQGGDTVICEMLICEMLIEKGADVNATDPNGKTSLMWAAEEGHTEMIKLANAE